MNHEWCIKITTPEWNRGDSVDKYNCQQQAGSNNIMNSTAYGDLQEHTRIYQILNIERGQANKQLQNYYKKDSNEKQIQI